MNSFSFIFLCVTRHLVKISLLQGLFVNTNRILLLLTPLKILCKNFCVSFTIQYFFNDGMFSLIFLFYKYREHFQSPLSLGTNNLTLLQFIYEFELHLHDENMFCCITYKFYKIFRTKICFLFKLQSLHKLFEIYLFTSTIYNLFYLLLKMGEEIF